MLKAKLLVRPVVAWVSVGWFFTLGAKWIAVLNRHVVAIGLFLWLFAVIIRVAFGVVHEAEELAERL
jgi:Ca2+:H+ antiporter